MQENTYYYDVLVSDRLAAVVEASLLKVFINALISVLPAEMNISTRAHMEAPVAAGPAVIEAAPETEEIEEGKQSN